MKNVLMLAAILSVGTAASTAAMAEKSNVPEKPGVAARPTSPALKAEPVKAEPPKKEAPKTTAAKKQPPKDKTPKKEPVRAQPLKAGASKPQIAKTPAPKTQVSKAQTSPAPAPKAPQLPLPSVPASLVQVRVVPGISSEAIGHSSRQNELQGLGQVRWQGQVVEVTDGDSLIVMFEDTPRRINLSGIDAPERGQEFGAEATGFLKSLVLGKTVQVQLRGRGTDGESLAQVTVGANDVATWMVADGYAWWHREDARFETDLHQKEAAARTARHGLWSEENPIAPWEFRKR